jgi:hypothetical protein
MRHLSVIGRVAAAAAFASVGFLAVPRPVAAECTFIPPLPKLSLAVGTAKELFVGDVVATGPSYAEFTVRIDEVLRGPAKVGDLRELRYIEPNWPWMNYPGGKPYASCSMLHGSVGETVVLALAARWPGGTLRVETLSWYQPPTTFNTMAIVNGSPHEQYGSGGRQLFSLERLRELAGVSPPATDTAVRHVGSSPARANAAIWLIGLAGVVGGLVALRRTARRR